MYFSNVHISWLMCSCLIFPKPFFQFTWWASNIPGDAVYLVHSSRCLTEVSRRNSDCDVPQFVVDLDPQTALDILCIIRIVWCIIRWSNRNSSLVSSSSRIILYRYMQACIYIYIYITWKGKGKKEIKRDLRFMI